MTPNELRALADCLDDQNAMQRTARRKAADYLRACAEAEPVAWRCEVRGDGSNPAWDGFGWRHYHTTTSEREALAFVARCGNGIEGRAVPLYPHPAPAVPAGWKLVPVEPTPEMLQAGASIMDFDRSGWYDADVSRAEYRAMLAAASAAPHYAMLDSHRRLVEQAIQSAEHPSGMSTHDGKARIDASILRRMLAIIDSSPAAPQAEPKRNQPLLDLLAVIHCDGGDHTEAVGIERSIKDALDAVCVLKGKLAQAEPKREPNPDEVICPACTHQFRAIPENVQKQLWAKREPLTYEQLVSACYTYRHDFGLLDPDEQELVIEEAGRWAKAFGIGGSDAE